MILIFISFFSDSTNLKLIEALTYDLPWAIDINGSYMYTCGGEHGEFYNVYSLDDPYHPRIISHWDRDDNGSKGKNNSSLLLYYSDRLYRGNNVMNVEDPYNIFKEGSINPYVDYMQIKDTILFANRYNWIGISIFSLSDPSFPILLSSYEPESIKANMPIFYVFDTLCYMTNGKSFEVANVKDPENPIFVSFNRSVIKNNNSLFDQLSGKDNYIYLYMDYDNNTLRKYNYSSVETLYTIDCSIVDTIELVDKDFVRDVDVGYNRRLESIIMDTLLYVLSNGCGMDTSYIGSYSISNPENPLLINEFSSEGQTSLDVLRDMDYSDSLLYVLGYYAGIRIFNHSLETLGYSCYSGKMKRVIQKNNLIYTGNYGAGIRIFRETPDTIYELTIGGKPYDVTDIALFDTLLYASSWCNGFYIFSIADSMDPILIYKDSILPDSLYFEYIAVDSDCIYLSGINSPIKFYIMDRHDYSIVSIMDSVAGRTFIRDTIGFIGDKILNLSDKTDPSIITYLNSDANALKDSLLYLDNGELYSVARVDSPVLIDSLYYGFGEFRGDSLYIICPVNYIIVYDILKPDSAFKVASGMVSSYRGWIEYAYPTLNRKIFTNECLYLGFIEQGGVKEKEKTKIPSSIVVDYIHFNFNDKYSVSIYDITGRKILNKELDGEGRIYVKDLSQGVYFISIPEKNLWEKILVLH